MSSACGRCCGSRRVRWWAISWSALRPRFAWDAWPRFWVAFHDEHPGLQLRIEEGYSAKLLEWLIQGEVDFALVNFVDGEKRLQYRNIVTEELVVVISHDTEWPGDIIRGDDVSAFKLVMPSPRNSLRMMIEANFTQAGLGLDVAMEIDSLAAVCNVVRHVGWASILPLSAVPTGRHLHAPRILRLIDPSITRSLSVAYQPQREPSAAAQLLIDHLSHSLRAQFVSAIPPLKP